MNDPKLDKALRAVDEAFSNGNAPVAQDETDDLATNLENTETNLRNLYQQNDQRRQDAENTLRNCADLEDDLHRLLRAIHAAKTELTRP